MQPKPVVLYPSKKEILLQCALAEKFFGTDVDPDQAQPTPENVARLTAIDKETYIYLEQDGEMVGWSVVLPTSKDLKDRFLQGKITEKEMFEKGTTAPYSFESLYLTGVVILPQFQKKGLGSYLMKHQIEHFKKKYGTQDSFAYILTDEGLGLLKKLERELSMQIEYIRK